MTAMTGRVLTTLALVGALLATSPHRAEAIPSCSGNNLIKIAPYECLTTRTIDGIDVSAHLTLTTSGALTVTFTVATPQQADIPVTVHNYTGISGDPHQFVDGVIAAGTTTTVIAIGQANCGQVDMKAIHTETGNPAGHIAGPVVQWDECAPPPPPPPPTTGSVPPTTTPPTSTTLLPPPSTVPGEAFISAVGSTCNGDVPHIVITIGNHPELDGQAGSITFIDVFGNVAEVHPFTYQSGATLDFLYPGAKVDPVTGEATDWPGWMLAPNGQWIQDPSDAFLRQGLTVRADIPPVGLPAAFHEGASAVLVAFHAAVVPLQVPPPEPITVSAPVTYPPESSACANPKNSPPPPVENLPPAGTGGVVAMVFAALGFLTFGGSMWRRRRRNRDETPWQG